VTTEAPFTANSAAIFIESPFGCLKPQFSGTTEPLSTAFQDRFLSSSKRTPVATSP
jgi:hypothetical protein